jgi:hypothetical protein
MGSKLPVLAFLKEAPKEILGVTVTRMGRRWIATLTVKGKAYDKMACALKADIGWMCREMLRWYDKLGGCSKWAASARRRQRGKPQGRVWSFTELHDEKRVKKNQ